MCPLLAPHRGRAGAARPQEHEKIVQSGKRQGLRACRRGGWLLLLGVAFHTATQQDAGAVTQEFLRQQERERALREGR